LSDTAEEKALALVGTTLGEGYRLQALIGQGSMGAVHRARSVTGAEVAVKTLRSEVMGREISQRFLRESELVRRLEHPHVVRTLDSGVDATTGLMFLVMPLLKGRDLDRILEELGALEPETGVRIALQAARGLSAAHRIGIIHRDVKPGNLILDEEAGELIVRVCDFGIAKQVGSASELTATGSQLGTPDYVSPEQLKSSKHVDERTDVWSLGATLYQMLCGAPPYAHIESVFDLIAAIMIEDVPHLQDRAPWVDASLALIVHQALQRDPNQRWASLEDMAEALRPFSGGDERLDAARIRSVTVERRRLVAARADLKQAPPQTSRPSPPLVEIDRSESAAQRRAEPSNNPSPKAVKQVVASATIAGGSRRRRAASSSLGASKRAMLGVAVLSAAIAGGSAYYFARDRGAPPTAPLPAPSTLEANVQVVPADARVVTRDGMIPVVAGFVTLRGRAGETLNVTVQQGAVSKTFSVSLGRDGVAIPGRLVLE
jgi:eukaryotic-like serine/threonine-protein kinase